LDRHKNAITDGPRRIDQNDNDNDCKQELEYEAYVVMGTVGSFEDNWIDAGSFPYQERAPDKGSEQVNKKVCW
jgi:hypothetical protein